MVRIFPILPILPIWFLYILAAVLPAALLLGYVYRQDTVEKEPPGLLALLLLMGIISAICSGFLETLAEGVLGLLVPSNSRLYLLLLAFLVVAVVEEGTKFFLLKRCTWHHPAFNFRFDGIVYAAFVSLGFAAYENIQYVLHYGLSVALPRALLAVPGHLAFAVYMGVFYGRAKCCAGNGDFYGVRKNLYRSFLGAVFLHGVYDLCALSGTAWATVAFVIFVSGMFFRTYRILKQESASDAPIC